MDVTISYYRPASRVRSIWLEQNNSLDWEMYYCPRCRNPILQFRGELRQEVPGEAPVSPSVLVKCKNPNCQTKYQFISFVSRSFE